MDEFMQEYPDPYLLARQHAARILLEHTGKAVDPRFVWWHQFTTASSSSRSFTGWQHSGPPQKSVSFTELVAQRFDLPFQDATDELDLYGGFYKEGAYASRFDEINEVPMLASDVQKDFWALNFADVYRAKITRFWSTQALTFKVLAKINLLGESAKAVRAGRITQAEGAALRTLASKDLEYGVLPTIDQLQANSTGVSLTASAYALGQSESACFFTFSSDSGRVLLYLPWSSQGIQGFTTDLAMAGWLREQLRDAKTMSTFLAAALVDPGEQAEANSARAVLQGIANSRSDHAALALLGFKRVSITDDFFVHITAQAQSDMQRSAAAMLDNAGLRKAMWSGYLSAFLNVFGAFAPLGWPMSLALLGAAVTRLGLGVDTALHATSEEARKSALRQAMLDSLFAALNLTELGFQSTFASLAYEAPFHETNASLAQWQVTRDPESILAGQETNQLIDGELATSGRLSGVRVDDKGGCWIEMNGFTYRVRYSHELSVWLVVPPGDPFAFGPLHPVRLNDAGEWKLLTPPALSGRNPPVVAGMISETSQFWDEYMATHVIQSQKFSAQARARQKKLLQTQAIPILGLGDLPAEDENGLACVTVDGKPQYTYREADGQYSNELIRYYTDDASSINDVLREGIHRYTDTVSYLNDLADTLESLPKNNAASLYRGGHGGRGTSGEHFRSGQLRVGDILVNTDLTSWTENPFMVRQFASVVDARGLDGAFDDSSVVFELPAGCYQSGIPISPFSLYWDEAESVFLPGSYFRIDKLVQVYGERYRFIHVSLSQVAKPVARPVYELRTGAVFDKAAYSARLGSPALADRFFAD
jgi:hypothetical protein